MNGGRISVAGATTSRVGSAAVRHLLEAGYEVRGERVRRVSRSGSFG